MMKRLDKQGLKSGTRQGSRTPNLLIRSQVLYPIELAAPGKVMKKTSGTVAVKPALLVDRPEFHRYGACKPFLNRFQYPPSSTIGAWQRGIFALGFLSQV